MTHDKECSIPNKAQVGDMGIDGRIFPVSATPDKEGEQVGQNRVTVFMDVWFPIQVKQTAKVGSPDIDAFETTMQCSTRKVGYFALMLGGTFKRARGVLERGRAPILA